MVKRVDLASTVTARNALDPQVWDPSPALVQKARLKVDKYAPLMQIIHKFQRDRSLEGDHSFVPFIVSSLGELSREAFDFREELISMFKFRVTSGSHQVYPLTPAQAVADYRLRLTSALMQVSALGLASITCTAGKPFRSHPIIAVY